MAAAAAAPSGAQRSPCSESLACSAPGAFGLGEWSEIEIGLRHSQGAGKRLSMSPHPSPGKSAGKSSRRPVNSAQFAKLSAASSAFPDRPNPPPCHVITPKWQVGDGRGGLAARIKAVEPSQANPDPLVQTYQTGAQIRPGGDTETEGPVNLNDLINILVLIKI